MRKGRIILIKAAEIELHSYAISGYYLTVSVVSGLLVHKIVHTNLDSNELTG